ncbi:MAG: asparagine synthase (glutamine-hydrolyzing) [Candidatus Eremiobacterota bacterium]
MSRVMLHRGPDDFGYLLWSPEGVAWTGHEIPENRPATVGFLHRRLSILDLSEGGWQPKSSPDGRYHITYNGEIYNFLELRHELEALGHRFTSTSDTEVLLRALITWGPAALNRLVGMFALGLLDVRERKLLMARDFFGIKPLYYTAWEHGLAFASEVKALLELPGVSREMHPQRLYDYLRFGLTDHAEETLLASVRQLPPGSWAEVDLTRRAWPEVRRYWSPSSDPVDIGYREAVDRLRRLFEENIRLHLRSDVPVGVALSGGVDSSSSVMTVRHLFPNQELHTFSYVAEGSPLNEERWARLVGEAARARMHTIRPGPGDLVEAMERLVSVQDFPFGSTSIFASFMLMRLVQRQGIKVILSGQGADEMLGGYELFRGALFASLVRCGRFTQAFRLLHSMIRRPGWKVHLMHAVSFMVPTALQDPLRRLVGRELMPNWMNADWFRERGARPQPVLRCSTGRVLTRELIHSLSYSSLPMLLRYEDRNSMAHSVESRVPFLTPRLAEFLYSLPETYIISTRGQTKSIFRDAMRGLVPDAVLEREDKIGFATPEQSWLTELSPMVDRAINSEVLRSIGAIRHDEVRAQWQMRLDGRLRFDFTTWRWLNLVRWCEETGATAAGFQARALTASGVGP